MFLTIIKRGINNEYSRKLVIFYHKCVHNQLKYSYKRLSRGYIVLSQNVNCLNQSRSLNQFCNNELFRNIETNSLDSSEKKLDSVQFERISNETLDSLTEYFDELIEKAEHLDDADVSYGDGVLTVKFGSNYGTYVINRQTPNKQIWLSSPTSGPKRYDFSDHTWIYKHDGKSMHDLLDEEIPVIVKGPTSFSKCTFSKRIK